MIIILSHTKTIKKSHYDNKQAPIFNEKAKQLINRLRTFDKESLKYIYNVNDNILEKLILDINSFGEHLQKVAYSYDGLVFKYFDVTNFNEEEYNFANNHIIILSAMYGVLKLSDSISNYRLDLNNSIGIDLKKFWYDDINSQFNNEIIVNLASKEYASLIDYKKNKVIDIKFLTKKNNEYKSISTQCKILRGVMAQYIVKNRINEISLIKEFNYNGYKYDPKLSSDEVYVFTN